MSKPTKPNRSAMTMIEIMISIGIFAAFTTVAMSSMLDLRHFIANTTDHDVLVEQSATFNRLLGRDLINTGWYYNNIALGTPEPLTPMILRNGVSYPTAPATGGTISRGSGILAQNTDDELFFLKLRSECALGSSPSANVPEVVDFNEPPVSLDDYVHGVPVSSLIFNTTYNPGVVPTPPPLDNAWESNRTGLTWDENANPDNLRIYRYRLDKSEGRMVAGQAVGTLSRLYRNALEISRTGEWIVDRDFSSDVTSLTFDTNLTDPTLANNHVRVRVVFARQPPNAPAVVNRTFQAVYAMRSMTSPGN